MQALTYPRPLLRVALVAVQIVLAFTVWQQATGAGAHYRETSDPARYRAIATTGGTPYRDFDVEYPPVAVAVFRALGPDSFGAFLRHLLLLNIALQLAIVLLVFRQWGPPAGWAYLALSAPLMPIAYIRFDLVVVLLAVAGAALAARRRPVWSALCWTVGAFVKVWPVTLLPSHLAAGRVRAFVTGVGAGIVGLAAWVAWGGFGGPRQVLTYRGANGWAFESVPGSVLRVVTAGSVNFDRDSWRTGSPSAVFGLALLAALFATAAWVWLRARAEPLPDGLAECSVITAVLVFGTLLSPQFLLWLVPFTAIVAVSRPRVAGWTAVVVGLTFLQWTSFDVNRAGAGTTELFVLARNAGLVGLFVMTLQAVAASSRRPVGDEPAVAA